MNFQYSRRCAKLILFLILITFLLLLTGKSIQKTYKINLGVRQYSLISLLSKDESEAKPSIKIHWEELYPFHDMDIEVKEKESQVNP